jgi:hypothetical protein
MNINNMDNDKGTGPDHFKKGMFGAPGDYFDKSAALIRNKIECMDELELYPLLLKNKKVPGFTTPAGYFDEPLFVQLYPKLSSLYNHLPVAAPQNYFERSEKQIKLLISPPARLDEYQRSDDTARVRTKVIWLYRKKVIFAAAAILLITAGFAIYQDYFISEQRSGCETIACIEKKVLLRTKNLERLENEELYELVDPEELMINLENKAEPGQDKKRFDTVMDQFNEFPEEI